MGQLDVSFERRSQSEISQAVRSIEARIGAGEVIGASIILTLADGHIQTQHLEMHPPATAKKPLLFLVGR